ncbi:MAG: hypothetical protein IPL39_04015 [Opitutaceae bacterium]|nr:hypothetical protein [Opitutaceae bacterium]
MSPISPDHTKGGANLYAMVRNAVIDRVDYLGMIDCYQLRLNRLEEELKQLLGDPNSAPSG